VTGIRYPGRTAHRKTAVIKFGKTPVLRRPATGSESGTAPMSRLAARNRVRKPAVATVSVARAHARVGRTTVGIAGTNRHARTSNATIKVETARGATGMRKAAAAGVAGVAVGIAKTGVTAEAAI
jgi:hypothetical protein